MSRNKSHYPIITLGEINLSFQDIFNQMIDRNAPSFFPQYYGLLGRRGAASSGGGGGEREQEDEEEGEGRLPKRGG